MIDQQAISEIFATYKKYGWILRRVLLSASLKNDLGELTAGLSNDVKIVDSTIDAAWFSRPPKSGGVAWEIRYLGEMPFALLENIDEEDADFENRLREVEDRLSNSIAAKRTA